MPKLESNDEGTLNEDFYYEVYALLSVLEIRDFKFPEFDLIY